MYIDIHTHTHYQDPETTLVLNTFPDETDKLDLPVYLSVGLHPWHVRENDWQTLVEAIAHVAGKKNVIAIGESGLDKTVKTDYFLQQKAFEAQLHIAQTHHKPMIIHCVRSYSELLAFRKKSDLKLPWIFHWFNADPQIARELIRKNCYLSFGHMLFKEQSKAFQVFQDIEPDHVFFETDDTGYTIQEIYEKASSIKNMDTGDLKSRIIHNFERCFQEL